MGQDFLKKIRKLNWVLSESTTGTLSFEDLSQILRDVINANVYILDKDGRVLGVAYTDADLLSKMNWDMRLYRMKIIAAF